MHGYESLPSKVYCYQAQEPDGAALVNEQISLAHRYRNDLTELEIKRRQQVEEAVRRHFPNLAALDAEIASVDEQIEAHLQGVRDRNARAHRKTGTPADRAETKRLKEARKELYGRRRQRRKDAFGSDEVVALRKEAYKAKGQVKRERDAAAERVLAQATHRLDLAVADWHGRVPEAQALAEDLAGIEVKVQDKAKGLRADCGLYWGTYLVVEQSLQSARQGAPPRFKRWTGDGKVAVQLQGGLSVAEAQECQDSRLRIEPLPEETWDPGVPESRQRTVARLRIGSEGRDPIWATIPIAMSRPLPADATIKWAYLVRRQVAAHYRWSVQLVLSRARGWPCEDVAAEGRVGVDVGWRKLESGLRVAYWCGSDGEEGQLVLPWPDVKRWKVVEDLQSVREGHFNMAKAMLSDWLRGAALPPPGIAEHISWLEQDLARTERRRVETHKEQKGKAHGISLLSKELAVYRSLKEQWQRQVDVADWLLEKTKNLHAWRSAGRLASVVIAWREQRFAGDEVIFAAMEAWRKRDKHLWEWQANKREKALAWREHLYRNFAVLLRRRYSTVALEEMDCSAFARVPAADEESANGALRHYQRIASIGRLLEILKQSGMRIDAQDAAKTTMRCHACGEESGELDRANLYHVCTNCGATWDQDRNAALNLLAASGEVVDESTVIARR